MSQSNVWPPGGWQGWGGVADVPVLWLDPKLPQAVLDYTVDITEAVDVGTDVITAASASAAPSGSGELSLNSMIVSGYDLTLFLSGGQPRRVYTIPVVVTMSDGRMPTFLVRIRISPNLDADQAAVPHSAGYGPTVNATIAPAPTILVSNGGVIYTTGSGASLVEG